MRSARIDDALIVATRYEEVQSARVSIRQRITRGDAAIATAEVQAACIDLTGRPRRAPTALMARLQPYLSGPS